jgi:outer membrane receptor protein involved in Fe transport
MTLGKATSIIALLMLTSSALAQTQTTGRITGTVKDQKGALIVGAEVKVTNANTGEARQTTTNEQGSYSVSLLPPGNYQVTIAARSFAPAHRAAKVVITETTTIDAELGFSLDTITVDVGSPLVQSEGPQLGRIVDARPVSELPLASRNFTQLLGLSTGTATALPNNGTIGRNTQNVSVNGARFTQNNFQINGIDANPGIGGSGARLADPAPETIAEFKVQTSLYDATFGRAGGGNIQIVTKSGTNNFHGALYEYFSNDALNANNPFLKAAGARRPVLKRNYFGGTVGGPVRRDKIFFFASYQGIRERNGISNSISSNVLIAPGLTDDRSEQKLRTTFGVPAIDPVALKLLNARSARGEFLIPTPQANGRYSGSSVSRSREDQFNANADFRISANNWLAIKFFFAQTPQTLALSGAANVPSFPVAQEVANRLLSVQDVHTLNSRVTNEARFGFNFTRRNVTTQQAIRDADIGITRPTAAAFPGLPLIGIASNAGGVLFGTSALQDTKSTAPVTTFADTLSITRGRHFIRAGGEIRYYQSNFDTPALTRGVINFTTFNDFLQGRTSPAPSTLANGITQRNLRTTDYNFFLQDDWKFSSKLTANLGLRYELDLPPYDTQGRISTFDPSLYKPRLLVNAAGLPQGPPIGGIVQAGNPIPQYDLPDVPNVGKRVLRSVDPNNFGPRVGFAYAPLDSGRLVLRGGYGIFYSRSGFVSINNSLFSPPFYLQAFSANASIENPFVLSVPLPAQDQFPILVPGFPLFGFTFDRNNRTPYVQQYNASAQFLFTKDMLWEVAYVGTRGLNLLRQVAINQARLASLQRPIINDVTGASITTNTPANA